MKDIGDFLSNLALLLAAIGSFLAGVAGIAEAIKKIKDLKGDGEEGDENKPPQSEHPQKDGLLRTPVFIIGILLLLLSAILFVVAVVFFRPLVTETKVLWTFEDSKEGWQYMISDDGRQVATSVDQYPDETNNITLRGTFDFGLATYEFPRATFFVESVEDPDWTKYQYLVFDAKSPEESLAIYISMTTDYTEPDRKCSNELGVWKYVSPTWQTLRFNLDEEKYKTCSHEDEYKYSHGSLSNVERFDIIIDTIVPESDRDKVQGYILIDNIRLEVDPDR